MCLMLSLALFSASAAIGSIEKSRERALPEKIYAEFKAQAAGAEYYLKARDGFVAVYRDPFFRGSPLMTSIETGVLRKADRAMLRLGIPVKNKTELLRLLEDLGS